jgi:hypothetical protein
VQCFIDNGYINRAINRVMLRFETLFFCLNVLYLLADVTAGHQNLDPNKLKTNVFFSLTISDVNISLVHVLGNFCMNSI